MTRKMKKKSKIRMCAIKDTNCRLSFTNLSLRMTVSGINLWGITLYLICSCLAADLNLRDAKKSQVARNTAGLTTTSQSPLTEAQLLSQRPAVTSCQHLTNVSFGALERHRNAKTNVPSARRWPRSVSPPPSTSVKTLHIIGLFGKNGTYPAGTAFECAAKMAENDINHRDDILPGYQIVIESINTQCDTAVGLDELYRKLYNTSSTKIMVLGATTSHVTEATTLASRKWNMTQISYSAVSPTLSDKSVFPWFFRVVAPESVSSLVTIKLLQHFNWTSISFLQHSMHLFSSSVELMGKDLKNNSIHILSTEPFDSYPKSAIMKLLERDARVIYMAAYEDMARVVCCEVYHIFEQSSRPNRIVWIFPGFFDLNWYRQKNDANCTPEQILKVIDGYFTVANVDLDMDSNHTIAGWPASSFFCLYCHNMSARDEHWGNLYPSACNCSNLHRNTFPAGSDRAPLAYDATWAVALALNATMTTLSARGTLGLENFTYNNSEMGQMIYENMRRVSFRGLSGEISFTNTGDRIPKTEIRQFQKVTQDLAEFVTIAVLEGGSEDVEFSNTVWFDDRIKWRYGKGAPPSSRPTENVLKALSLNLYIVMCSLASVGGLLSLFFLVFNVKCRQARPIKMSSPRINNLILGGCVLVYATICVEDVELRRLDILCHLWQYFMVLGFSLGYGALFAKTWRVYEIMTARHILNTKKLRDSRLFMTVGVLVVVNLSVLITWTAFDPMHMVAEDTGDSENDDDNDVVRVSQMLVCRSTYKVHFTVTLLALQALLILFGVFLAWQTRKMSIPELNDSRWIGLCIYNVIMLGSLAVILPYATHQTPHVVYILQSGIVFVGTTMTQCFVFVPKLLSYRQMQTQNSEKKVLKIRTLDIVTSGSCTPCTCALRSSSNSSIRSGSQQPTITPSTSRQSSVTETSHISLCESFLALFLSRRESQESVGASPVPGKIMTIDQALHYESRSVISDDLVSPQKNSRADPTSKLGTNGAQNHGENGLCKNVNPLQTYSHIRFQFVDHEESHLKSNPLDPCSAENYQSFQTDVMLMDTLERRATVPDTNMDDMKDASQDRSGGDGLTSSDFELPLHVKSLLLESRSLCTGTTSSVGDELFSCLSYKICRSCFAMTLPDFLVSTQTNRDRRQPD